MRPAVADYPSGAQTPLRVIDDYELVWMLRGRARLVTDAVADTDADADDADDADDAGGRSLLPGRLALVPPGVQHGFVWDERRPCRHGYVHFGAEYLGGARVTDVTVRPMTADDPLAGLCAYLLWLARSELDGWLAPAERALRHVVALVVGGPLPPADPPPAVAGPVSAAIGYLRREWAEMPLRRVTVAELASAAAVSRGYLERLFRDSFGTGVAAGLERVRCSRAETLLARTDLTLDAVARQCGFADGSHFAHRFTARYGVSPREYRRGGGVPSVLDDPSVRRLAGLIWG